MFTKDDFVKYPFIREASLYVEGLGVTLSDLAKPEYGNVVERAVERVFEAIDRALIKTDWRDVDVELLSYPVSIALISAVDDQLLTRIYAEAEAERVYRFLKDEDDGKLMDIARNTFSFNLAKVDVKAGGFPYEYAISVFDYVKLASGFHDSYWKLVNRDVSSGFVYLKKSEVARLIKEALKNKMKATTPLREIPPALREAVDKITAYFTSRRKALKVEEEYKGPIIQKAFPPCTRQILSDILSGRSVPHMARFTITSFLISVGKSVEEVIDIYRHAVDFDESKTKYQVKHIAGQIGSKTKYSAPSCDTLKTFNLCIEPDELCRKVKHPLTYYRRKARILEKKPQQAGF